MKNVILLFVTALIGVIEPNLAANATPIGPGFSGSWFNPTPNQGGHFILAEVLPNNGMLAIWYVFNPAGTAQTWIYFQGSYDPASSMATLPAYLETGGTFPPKFDGSKLTVTPWGSLTLSFTDCNNGTASYISNSESAAAGYGNATFPIQRATSIAGTSCPNDVIYQSNFD